MLQVHRLVVVDNERRVVGILSLSDILSYLVLRPANLYDTTAAGTSQRSPNRPLFALDEDPPPET